MCAITRPYDHIGASWQLIGLDQYPEWCTTRFAAELLLARDKTYCKTLCYC